LQRSQVALHAAILILLLLSLLPVYLMISVSVKNPLQFQHERWVPSFPLRLGNYSAAWDVVSSYIWNTMYVAAVGFLGMLALSVIGGYVFARMKFPFREPLFFAIIALLMVPWVISFVPAYMLYGDLGLLNTRWALIVPNIAGGPVFGIFLLRSFFAGIPDELYEAARIDGAGHLRLILGLTLPLSLPVLATLAVINFVSTWNSFLWPLVTISDDSKQIISVGLYRLSSEVAVSGDASVWGPLFAGYGIATLPLAILFFALGKWYIEGLVESGLKA
jgi:ABC-type glycerol-3-phosphate transport system permease component